MFAHRHPKYTRADALRRHPGLQALARHLIRYCGNIGNYRLWAFSLYISALHSVNYLPHVCVCVRRCAHTHTHIHAPSSLSWCGWQLLWNSSHSWQENHKFLIQTSTSSVLAERNPSIKNQHPTPMSALWPLTLPPAALLGHWVRVWPFLINFLMQGNG